MPSNVLPSLILLYPLAITWLVYARPTDQLHCLAVAATTATPSLSCSPVANRFLLRTYRPPSYLGFCGYKKHRDLMEVYRDFGLHNIFASSLVREHTVGDERFSADELYRAGKHYPRPMRCGPRRFGVVLVSPPS